MRILWTLFKVIVGLAIAIPVGLLVLGLTFGLVRLAIRLAIVGLMLACVAFVGVGLFNFARRVFGSPVAPKAPPVRDLPRADPYYEAAMRELDSELRTTVR